MRFDLTDLRLFIHVAESGSITQGADRAHMALASASARIRGMEAVLGTALLERGRRGVRPTPAGHTLVHHARAVIRQLERMRGELAAYGQGLKGHVRLLSNTAALSEFLPEALAAFLADNPHVDIDVEERLSHEIIRAIAEGLADIGIVAEPVESDELESFPFRTDRLVVVVARDHRLADRRRLAFREVVDEAFVGLTRDSALQGYLSQHAARIGRTLKLRVRLRGFDGVCRMAAQGVGLGVVPRTAARRCRRTMAIRVLPLADAWALRELRLCVRRFDELSAHARRLIEHLAAPDADDG